MSGLPEPHPEARARSDALAERIRGRVRAAGGWIGFDEYMQMALYEPGLGYYDAAGRKFGAQGDYITAPMISPLFARALAAQVEQAFCGLPPRVLEFGAGTGALAQGLLAELEARGHRGVEYSILEVSADLRARQRELLPGSNVRWLDSLPEGFEGVVIANEVLDVMPVRMVAYGGGQAPGWVERGVGLGEGGTLLLRDGPPPADLGSELAAIERAAGEIPSGFASEVAPQAAAWVASLGAMLRRGLVIVIDYGFPAREYYHPQRAMGTLLCHYRHHAHADPLWLPGLNDITAHVDFSACARAAHAAGLEVLGYTSQAHFLMNCGILELLQSAPGESGAVQRLLSEAEMGELLKVIALGRGVPADLIGFDRGDRSHRL
jgi:SAM-dependent MidA family methyltransferase